MPGLGVHAVGSPVKREVREDAFPHGAIFTNMILLVPELTFVSHVQWSPLPQIFKNLLSILNVSDTYNLMKKKSRGFLSWFSGKDLSLP